MDLDIPRIETRRLILREWREEDLEPYAEFMADEEMVRYLGGVTKDRDETWRLIAAFVGHWALRGFGLWAVEDKADGAFVGEVGLWFPEGWPAIEVGWSIMKPHQGKGYATEAARASAQWAFEHLELDSLISVIHPENAASIAVAKKLGESMSHMHTVKGIECCIYKGAKDELIF